MSFEDYKQQLIDHLEMTKRCILGDIAKHELLSDVEKVEAGFIIKCAKFVRFLNNDKTICELNVLENNTKWRSGDKLKYIVKNITTGNKVFAGSCIVEENYLETIQLKGMPDALDDTTYIDLTFEEPELISLFINVIKSIKETGSGATLIKIMAGIIEPWAKGISTLDSSRISFPSHLEEKQQDIVKDVANRPAVYCIQGPPGTGKTDMLAFLAKTFSDQGKDVLIIANTHQAVCNALNKLEKYNVANIFKVGGGKPQKGLNRSVTILADIKEYNAFRRKRLKPRAQANGMHRTGDVVGMTLCGSIINMAFLRSAFAPLVVLVDEASQIPMTQAAALGTMGAGTIVFIGDERQLPPVFPSDVRTEEMSTSIFDFMKKRLPDNLKSVLMTTFRMNRVICDFVSRNFYEPFGVRLISHESIAERHIDGEDIDNSIQVIDVASQPSEEYNTEEAKEAAKQALLYRGKGKNVAVLAPFRKQVNAIRETWTSLSNEYVLIDTVERLQGQDVDVMVFSFTVSNPQYIQNIRSFLFDPHRMNVVISRAKEKVIIIKSPLIQYGSW